VKVKITQALLGTLKAGSYDLSDLDQRALVLRVRPTGHHSWLLRLGRGQWYTLGRSDVLTPTQARELARRKLGDKAYGRDPITERRRKAAKTFGEFLTGLYADWFTANRKSATSTLARLTTHFVPLFGSKPLTEITTFAVERWRTARLRGATGATAATTNRNISALKACLSKAVEWKLLPAHPLRDVKLSREDRNAIVRFLSPDEEKALRAQLVKRDTERRTERASANEWRRVRGYAPLPDIGVYCDHLTPITLLAMNTGMRRGELFSLRWGDVDEQQALITVRGEGTKSSRTRRIPANTEVLTVLKNWKPESADPGAFVFPGTDGERLVSLKTAFLGVLKAAGITNFRFHDTRHHFASRLVQHGVDLYTVQMLLGHASSALTERYSHLADDNLSKAVAKLVNAR
jgi:integrase